MSQFNFIRKLILLLSSHLDRAAAYFSGPFRLGIRNILGLREASGISNLLSSEKTLDAPRGSFKDSLVVVQCIRP